LLLAVALTFISDLWMRQDGIIGHAIQLGESVPPVPAVAAIILLLALNPVLARIHTRLRLSHAEVLVVFTILAITPVINSVGGTRVWLPSLNVLQYFHTPENNFHRFWEYIPEWYGPRDPEVIRQFYEGVDHPTRTGWQAWVLGSVPWDAWLKPLALWGLFWTVFFTTTLCLVNIFRRQWMERERLTFPLVQVVLELTEESQGSPRQAAAFFKNPMLWLGFSLSFFYNIMNILNAYNPSIPALGRGFDLGALFTEHPWNAIQPLYLAWRPEIFGLGYLMSLEVTFSAWFFYLVLRLTNVAATMLGYQVAGLPFDQEQSFGAYLALTLFLAYIGRRQIGDVIRKALWFGRDVEDAGEAFSYRWSFLGALAGMVFLCGWCYLAGMFIWWLPILYFSLILAVAFVYARVRAETGAPMVWLFPFWQQERMIINVLGTKPLTPGGDFRALTIFSSFIWLVRGFYPSTMATQMESLKMGREIRMPLKHMALALLFAVVLGIIAADWLHLTTYYEYGGNVLEGGSTQGGYRILLNYQEYTTLSGYAQEPKPWDRARTIWSGVGFGVTALMIILRMIFLRFPLHPLGFAMVTAYGHPLWGPLFFVWLIKWTILRVGGVQLYKKLIPLFVGIVLGHFFTAGLVWGVIGMIDEEITMKYVVHFG